MAKKKRAGRPKGSKNKSRKPGRRRGWKKSNSQGVSATTFSSQIESLQEERKKLLANVAAIDKAIVIFKKLV